MPVYSPKRQPDSDQPDRGQPVLKYITLPNHFAADHPLIPWTEAARRESTRPRLTSIGTPTEKANRGSTIPQAIKLT